MQQLKCCCQGFQTVFNIYENLGYSSLTFLLLKNVKGAEQWKL